MTPSSTDQYFLCPSQPVRSLPLKSRTSSRLPVLGGTRGASGFFAWAKAARASSRGRVATNLRMAYLQATGERAGVVYAPPLGVPARHAGADVAEGYHAKASSESLGKPR